MDITTNNIICAKLAQNITDDLYKSLYQIEYTTLEALTPEHFNKIIEQKK